MKFDNLIKLIKENIDDEDSYRGLHQAPMKDSGSPLYNLKDIYPDDIYSPNAVKYYPHYGDYRDANPIRIIQAYKNKPNAIIKIYRSIPYMPSNIEKIKDIETEMAYIQKYGKTSNKVNSPLKRSDYYNHINKELEKLKSLPVESINKFKINIGDWVTIDKKYVLEHGESALHGKHKIISKNVYARDLFTNGDSIFEWGYDPQPRVTKDAL